MVLRGKKSKGLLIAALGLLPMLDIAVAAEGNDAPAPLAAEAGNGIDRPPLDVDALAARMTDHQDLYQKIRDEGLAEYSKTHPEANPNDEEARSFIRLFAYLWVWDDFYAEGLWRRCAEDIARSNLAGVKDPLLQTLIYIVKGRNATTPSEESAQRLNATTDQFLATGYPNAFKLLACQATLRNLANYRSFHHPDPQSPSLQARGHFVEEWGKCYRELIDEGLPNERLYFLGDAVLHAFQNDEETLDLVIAELDGDFAEAAPDNPVAIELDGDFQTVDAWNARGTGWGNTVTKEGWQLFGERLDKAAEILEPLYDRYPDELGTCYAMMTVELGQGKGRDGMELWFHRAIKIDPDNFRVYKSKAWYLQPRWNGSEEEVLDFGQQCALSGKWSAKLPMILPLALEDVGEPALYARPEVWEILETVYREFLKRYPNSSSYRTRFAKDAYDGGHQEIAREQLKLLGSDWDIEILPIPQHAKMVEALGLK